MFFHVFPCFQLSVLDSGMAMARRRQPIRSSSNHGQQRHAREAAAAAVFVSSKFQLELAGG
jgi:hypothetical protein